MLKVAMISKWHVHARDYAKMITELDNAEITCVWDEDAKRGAEWAKELGVDFEANYDAILKRDDVDAVVIDTPTSMHKEVMIKAAAAKKHIFTEKVLAATVTDCNEIAKAITENDVKFCISYPQRSTPAFIYAKELVDSGKLGKISIVRIRNGHDGATRDWLPSYWYGKKEACGGVMLDLGCHPMYLSRWILGTPKSVSSQFAYFTGKEVEDNAVCTVSFESGAVAIVESSFVAPNSPYIMEIYGDKGTFISIGDEIKVKYEGTEWFAPESLPPKPISAIEGWVKACLNGGETPFGLKDAIELTELMEAAYIAAEKKQEVLI